MSDGGHCSICSLFTVHCSLLTVYCLLLTAYCLLPTALPGTKKSQNDVKDQTLALNMFKNRIFAFSLLCALCIPVQQNATPPSLSYVPETWQQEMLRLVNQIRSEGCTCDQEAMPPAKPLKWNSQLAKAAQKHAEDMNHNNFIGHNGSNGSRIGQRVSRSGYEWKSVAENAAWNVRTVNGAVIGWKNSPGHCRSMMGGYNDMGAAHVGRYWVQVFGRERK